MNDEVTGYVDAAGESQYGGLLEVSLSGWKIRSERDVLSYTRSCTKQAVTCGQLLNDGNKRQGTALIRDGLIKGVVLELSLKAGEILWLMRRVVE